jgi:hypothetical protein
MLSRLQEDEMSHEFSVCQFFPDETYEYVRRNVSPEEAMEAFKHYITCVGAKLGTTRRVIITDGWDCTNAEWKFGEGMTYPPGNRGEFK